MMVGATAISLQTALRAHQAGQLAPAEHIYRCVLEAEPENIEAQHLLGVVLLQNGDPEGALPLLEQAATRAPERPDYHNRLGVALAALGRIDEAIVAYRKAIASKPDQPEAHNNLAIALAASGDHPAAIIAYRRALTVQPGFSEAHNGLGVALSAIGDFEEAEHHYRRALDIRPDYSDARANLGDLLVRSSRLNEAIAELTTALDQRPDHFEARLSLADAYARSGEIAKALAAAKAILKSNPQSARAHNCYGMICRQSGDTAAGLSHLDRAIVLDADLSDAHANRAIALLTLGRFEASEQAAGQAVSLSGDAAVHRVNLGMIRLLRGDFRRGFKDYRARFGSGTPWIGRRRFALPEWDGENIDGKRLLAWGEQGVGEEVMFAGLLPRLLSRAASCVVECDPRLVALMSRSFPLLEVVGRTDPLAPALLRHDIDCTLAFGDIPAALNLGEADFAEPKAYLIPDAAQVGVLRARLEQLGAAPKIGIAWRSRGANTLFSLDKSTDLQEWGEILQARSVQFVSLQYGDTDMEISDAEACHGVSISTDTGIDQTVDLDGFAALIVALDLVITTSNTTAHLAGALGKEVWIIVPHVPDWRWQLRRADTLWYPHARLFRQPGPGDWRGAVAEVAGALAARARA